MARQMKTEGMEQLTEAFEKLDAQAGAVAAKALYVGAGIVADSVRSAVDGLATEHFFLANENHRRLASPEEKAALAAHLPGIARFEKNGAEVSTAVGLKDAGYAKIAGKDIPVPLLARAVNSGTSFRVKQPFFRQAVNKAKGKASAAIVAEVEKAVQEIFGNYKK